MWKMIPCLVFRGGRRIIKHSFLFGHCWLCEALPLCYIFMLFLTYFLTMGWSLPHLFTESASWWTDSNIIFFFPWMCCNLYYHLLLLFLMRPSLIRLGIREEDDGKITKKIQKQEACSCCCFSVIYSAKIFSRKNKGIIIA